MTIIKNINDDLFSVDDFIYPKIFMPVQIDEQRLKIVSIYDVSMVLMEATNFQDISIDGASKATIKDSFNSISKLVFGTIEEVIAPTEPTAPSNEIKSNEYYLTLTKPLKDQPFTEGETILLETDVTPVTLEASPLNFQATDILHFGAYGQSLSSGTDSQPMLSIANVGGNVTVQDEWHVFDLSTPVGLNTQFPMKFDGTTTATYVAAPSEGPVIGWANSFKAGLLREVPSSPLNNSKVMCSTSSKGGIQISGLMKGTDIYNNQFLKAMQAGKDSATLLNQTISCPALLFMQGESEPATETYASYKANIIQLFNDMRADAAAIHGHPTILPTIFVYQPEQAPSFVKMVYADIIKEYNWIVGVGNVYYLPDVTIHLDPNGSRWIGEQFGKATVKMLRDNVKYQPLLIKSTEIIGNKVIVNFNKPVVIDDRPKGWAGNTLSLQGLSSTNILENDRMILETGIADLTTYGELILTVTSSKIRDRDSYEATTLYSDYVRIKANGNDFKDENGNIIYGQKYPLWNWLYDYSYKIQ